MSALKVETELDYPFDWLNEEAWTWMAEMTSKHFYSYMDDVYRVIKGDITKEDFEDYGYEDVPEDFKKKYEEGFPTLIAQCLENLADSIRKKEIVFEIDFGDKK